MSKLFAGIHIPDKPQEFIPLSNVNLGENVSYLKARIAEEIKYSDAKNLELVFDGRTLENDVELSTVVKPNGIVYCFQKTKQYEPYDPPIDKFKSPETIARIQNLFTVIAHIQINVNSRVIIWQKILTEYPEFRRNLGAQAIIRDSVLFNTMHDSETIERISIYYPIICEAAPFIVDTIKKELARNAAATANNLISEAVNDSPNSSEEESSIGAASNNDTEAANTSNSRSERGTLAITRQQLQDALAEAGIFSNTSSVNSLSNIAQRNADSNTSTPLSSSASGERISAEMFRQQMQRAFSLLPAANPTPTTAATTPTTTATTSESTQPMDTTEAPATAADNDDIPALYHSHEYAEQMRTMFQMGFHNHVDNLTFLNLTNGSIENAINLFMATMNE